MEGVAGCFRSCEAMVADSSLLRRDAETTRDFFFDFPFPFAYAKTGYFLWVLTFIFIILSNNMQRNRTLYPRR